MGSKLLLSLPWNIHLQNFYRLDAFQINKRSDFSSPPRPVKILWWCFVIGSQVHFLCGHLNFFVFYSFHLVVPGLFVNAIEISCAVELDGQSCECDEFRIFAAEGYLVSLQSSSV